MGTSISDKFLILCWMENGKFYYSNKQSFICMTFLAYNINIVDNLTKTLCMQQGALSIFIVIWCTIVVIILLFSEIEDFLFQPSIQTTYIYILLQAFLCSEIHSAWSCVKRSESLKKALFVSAFFRVQRKWGWKVAVQVVRGWIYSLHLEKEGHSFISIR